jgi:hypothetical protein
MPGLFAIPAQAPLRLEGCKVVFLPAKTTEPGIRLLMPGYPASRGKISLYAVTLQ